MKEIAVNTVATMVFILGDSVVIVEDGCATELLVAEGINDGTITIVGNRHMPKLTFSQ